MAPTVTVPDAPEHLSKKAAKQWQAAFTTALAQAKINYPDNESAQRSAATKAANTLLAVVPPTSADEINALGDWQVINRGVRVNNKTGVREAYCVAADGRKYAFPVTTKSATAKQEAPQGAKV